MALNDPTQIRTTDLDNATTSYTAGQEPWNKNLDGYVIPNKDTDASSYQADWSKWHGLYRKIPELRSTIDTESRWIIGKKIKMDKRAKDLDKKLRRPLRTILLNMKRTAKINGDSFAWIPRDKAGRLLNIKILDPGSIEIQADKFGVIKKYVQMSEKGSDSKIDGGENTVLEEWSPDEIFHVINDSIADEIHGIPEAEKLQDIIKMRHQSMSDNTVILHRYGKPTMFFEADTDTDAELDKVASTIDAAVKNFENVVVPKGTLSKIDRVTTPQFGTLDPMPWLNFLRSYFTEASGVPDLVRGKSDEVSLAAGKLNVLTYKQRIIFQQLEYEEDIAKQLKIGVEFEEPVEIDIEISRTEEDMALKESAKKQKGGENIVTEKKRTSE